MPKGPFLPAEFLPTQFSTTADKAEFGNTLLHFLDAGCGQNLLTKKLYNRLSMTFGNMAKAAAAFSQGKPVNGITLNATAEWIAGSDNETGNATLTANVDGSYSIQLQLAQSSRTEAQTSFASGQSCTWSGTDGVSHPVAGHNCMGSVAWFLPAVSLFGNQQPSAVGTFLESSTASAESQFLDIRQQMTPPASFTSDAAALLTHLSAVDLYLDPASYLPTGLAFNIHPDDNAASDIPVQVVFTNYQTINGVSIPFRIQRYVNGSLQLDLTVTQASTN